MKMFRVTERTVLIYSTLIEAEDKDDAIDAFYLGEGEVEDRDTEPYPDDEEAITVEEVEP